MREIAGSGTQNVFVNILIKILPIYDLVANLPSWDTNTSMNEIEFMNVLSGSVVKFVCKATGNPQPQLLWYCGGKRLTNNSRRKLGYNVLAIKREIIFVAFSF